MVKNVDYKPKIELFTNIDQFSLQEVFDFVVEHLRKQGKPAKSQDGQCFYFDEETGNRCAVGCLISSDNYDDRFEGVGVDSIYGSKENILDLLAYLQGVHDEYDVDCWEEEFQEVANAYDLYYSQSSPPSS